MVFFILVGVLWYFSIGEKHFLHWYLLITQWILDESWRWAAKIRKFETWKVKVLQVNWKVGLIPGMEHNLFAIYVSLSLLAMKFSGAILKFLRLYNLININWLKTDFNITIKVWRVLKKHFHTTNSRIQLGLKISTYRIWKRFKCKIE